MSRIARPLALISLLGLVACSPPEPDPATAEPVDLTPGLYRISLSAAGIAGYVAPAGKDDARDEVCVRPSDSAGFADQVVENYFTLHPGCRKQSEPRVGNVIRGIITCPLDPKMSTGTSTVTYEGILSTDRVEVTSRMSMDLQPVPGTLSPEEQRQLAVGSAVMETVGIRVAAVRSGDCI